ncbi:putative signal transduction protein [Anaeromyxobacter dehalogenans 2CP-1]|uniref:Signal transduction protein n=1 Tax=Anaeromyxobacter dehalogenans (strain ATCC BAA-258 / DSM 21875 / 2CP-1) TaxID=455488 RepID=B8JCI3_ANAD2|nr:HDOD domain-containing protein [Anaeromyxobacter dehalogenans]ACL65923.1 putative signal transduction protein [Anaeromyxobacter dehalogenans 2CP-1]
MSVDKLSAELEAILVKRIETDQLFLPTLPAVAARVLDVLRDPDAGMKEAAQILEKDPVLAARALRMATSAAFAGGTRKITLQEALARLGTRALKGLLVEASAQKLFVSRDAQINAALKALWEHSVAVGILARDVLALTGTGDSESAYLAGLLHDVGKPVVASVLLEVERQLTEVYQRGWIDSGEWLAVVGRVHRRVGVALAEKWQLPAPLVACIREATEFEKGDRASLANAVCFANALAKKSGIFAGAIDAEDVDALVMIGRSVIGISDDVLRTLTRGLRERVRGIYD